MLRLRRRWRSAQRLDGRTSDGASTAATTPAPSARATSPRHFGSPPPTPTRRGPHQGRRGLADLGRAARAGRRARRRARGARRRARATRSALMLSNRPEFHIADLAVMTLGATPFSIYRTFSPEQIAYVVGDAGARVAIDRVGVPDACRGAPSAAGARARDRARRRGGDGHDPLADVEGRPGFDAEPHWRAVGPDDLVTLIYTSGTTGPPKGVQLDAPQPDGRGRAIDRDADPVPGRREGDLVAAGRAHRRADGTPLPADRLRDDGHVLPGPARDHRRTCRRCGRPGSSPSRASGRSSRRAWRRVRCLQRRERQRATRRGSRRAKRKVELEQAGEEVPADLAARVAEADRELFAGLRTMLGLDEAVSVNVGAAPTPREVLVFFHAIGIPLAELWGMSETCGAGAVQPAGPRSRSARSARRRPGVELRLGRRRRAADPRSDVVMPGYRNCAGQDGRGARRRRLAAHRRHRARSTTTATSRSSTARRRSSSTRPARTCRRPTSSRRSRAPSPLIGQACVIGDGAALQHRADRARRRLRARRGRRSTGIEADRLAALARRRARPRRGAEGRRRGQRAARAGRADQEVHARRRATGCPAATSSRRR